MQQAQLLFTQQNCKTDKTKIKNIQALHQQTDYLLWFIQHALTDASCFRYFSCPPCLPSQ